MTCFICNLNNPISTFYCAVCKSKEICMICWQNWLETDFKCPFCKNDKFLLEITISNFFNIYNNDFKFLKFNIYSKIQNNVYENKQEININKVLKSYTPFYNDVYAKNNFFYYYNIKTYSDMNIVSTFYEKWILCIILNEILYNNWELNEKDVCHFGGYSFINFINKHFSNKIFITNKITKIHFNSKLWSPRKCNTSIESNIMTFMLDTLHLKNPLFLHQFVINPTIKINLNESDDLLETFALYLQIKYCYYDYGSDKILDNDYFNLYIVSINNKLCLV